MAAAGCSSGSSPRKLPRHETFGARTSTPLTLERASATDTATIKESVARKAIEHPFSAPALEGPLRQFGLARVTATGLAARGSTPPQYVGRLAWVGVYRIKKGGPHSCTGGAQSPPASPAPVLRHYYFVVLVDAVTGEEATWTEDMSGLLARECARNPGA